MMHNDDCESYKMNTPHVSLRQSVEERIRGHDRDDGVVTTGTIGRALRKEDQGRFKKRGCTSRTKETREWYERQRR